MKQNIVGVKMNTLANRKIALKRLSKIMSIMNMTTVILML
nr:MAG TPA: hypothetical protein [Caudoviricetes sp.]